MCNKAFALLVVILVIVVGQWQHGEALQESRAATERKQQQLQQQHQEQRPAMRRRRGLRIIMPGTQWCGTGNVSTANQSYGNVVATDRCCQAHDSCAFAIGAFSRAYGLFNYRPYTISHCECDDVFRSCLRTVGSEEANMVGRLFFNVVGTKCFVLRVRRESVCVERAWWGRCNREETVNNHYAEIRGPLSY